MNSSTVPINKQKPLEAEKIDGALWLFVACLLCGVLYSVTGAAVLGLLPSCAICLYLLVSPPEEGYIFLLGMQFMRAVIVVPVGDSRFGFVLLAYAILAFKMFLAKEKLYGEYGLLLLLLAVDVAAGALGGALHIGDSINWVASFLCMLYILKSVADKIDFEKLFTFFLLAQWAICLVNILAEWQIFGRSLVPDMYGVWVDGYELFSFGKAYLSIAGGNEIALNNAMAIALCVMLFPYVKKTATRVFYVLSVLFLGYCGFMLIARGFYVELLLFFALYLLSGIKEPQKLITALCVIGLVGVVFYFVASDLVWVVLERVLVRFEGGNTTREDLLAQAGALLLEDPRTFLLGAGTYYPERFGFTVHNHYIDAFLALGLFGGLLYLGLLGRAVFEVLRTHAKLSLRALLPLIMLVTYKTISGSVRDVGFYYYVAMTLLFAVYWTRRQESEAA